MDTIHRGIRLPRRHCNRAHQASTMRHLPVDHRPLAIPLRRRRQEKWTMTCHQVTKTQSRRTLRQSMDQDRQAIRPMVLVPSKRLRSTRTANQDLGEG